MASIQLLDCELPSYMYLNSMLETKPVFMKCVCIANEHLALSLMLYDLLIASGFIHTVTLQWATKVLRHLAVKFNF